MACFIEVFIKLNLKVCVCVRWRVLLCEWWYGIHVRLQHQTPTCSKATNAKYNMFDDWSKFVLKLLLILSHSLTLTFSLSLSSAALHDRHEI